MAAGVVVVVVMVRIAHRRNHRRVERVPVHVEGVQGLTVKVVRVVEGVDVSRGCGAQHEPRQRGHVRLLRAGEGKRKLLRFLRMP